MRLTTIGVGLSSFGGAASRLFSGAAIFAMAGSSAVAQQFVDQSSTRLIPSNLLEYSNAVDIADADGDGDLDVLFANGSGFSSQGTAPQRQRLYINNINDMFGGLGTLTEDSAARLNSITAYCRDMDFADVDGDGDLDIVMANTWGNGNVANPNPGQPRILMNNVGGSSPGFYTDETSTRFPTMNLFSEEVSLADVDNDGDLDAYFCNGAVASPTPMQDRLFINDGTGHFTDQTVGRLPIQNLPNAQDCDFVDLDADLDLDAVISHRAASNPGGRIRVYLNNGAGVFTDITTAATNTTDTYGIALADIDGDLDMDLFGVNSGAGGADFLWRGDGLGGFTLTALPANSNDDNDAQFYDIDNDGDMDFVVAALNTAERVYRNTNGMGTFTIVGGAFSAVNDSTLDIAFGDLDDDGKLDSVTAQGESGSFLNRVYMNIGAGSATDTLPPTVANFTHYTGMVAPDPNGYVVRADVRDCITGDNGAFFAFVRLNWTVGEGGASGMVDMTWSGGDIYRGVIPAMPEGTTVEYSITAADRFGNAGPTTPATDTFTIMSPVIPPTIVASAPSNGSVDLLQDQDAVGTLQGITALSITFSEPVRDAASDGPLTPASFGVALTTNLVGLTPPIITSVTPSAGDSYDLAFDSPVTPGAWTTVTAVVEDLGGAAIDPASASVDLGFLPGDANRNGTVNTQDLLAEVTGLNLCGTEGTCSDPLIIAQFDMNRSGTANTQDLLRLVQLLNGVLTQNAWNGVTLPAQP